MRVTALMACHNRRELTLRALGSLFAQSSDAVVRAVVVDDGSTDGTGEAVRRKFAGARVITGDGSMYWASAMALAETLALQDAPDVLLWLNDDVTLDSTALEVLATTSGSTNPPAVVAGAVCDPVDGTVTYGGLRVSRWHPLRTRLVEPSGMAMAVDGFNGNVVWVPIEATRTAGPIDGDYAHAYADNDYGLRLARAHYPVLTSPQCVGTCDRETSSRSTGDRPRTIRGRWAQLNSRRGLPVRSQFRFFRRHGPPVIWPVYALAPYLREALPRPAHGRLGPDNDSDKD